MIETIESENEKIIFENKTIRINKKESGLEKDLIIKESFIESIEINRITDYTVSIIIGCIFLSSIGAIYTYFRTSIIYFYVTISMILFFIGYIIYYQLNNDLSNKIIIKTSNNEISLNFNEKVFEKLIEIIKKEEINNKSENEKIKKVEEENYPKFVLKEN